MKERGPDHTARPPLTPHRYELTAYWFATSSRHSSLA